MLYSQNRKRHQRKINHYVKLANQALKKDELWRGRFEIHQIGSPTFWRYDDKSGCVFSFVQLEIIDKLTGETYTEYGNSNDWCNWNGSEIGSFINHAIVEVFKVWTFAHNPNETRNNPDYNFNNPKVCEKWRKAWKNK